jgi:hypothetical protein
MEAGGSGNLESEKPVNQGLCGTAYPPVAASDITTKRVS